MKKDQSRPRVVAVTPALILLCRGMLLAQDAVHCVMVTPLDPRFSSCQYVDATIQAAVIAANPGDEVLVGTGIYDEQVTITKALLLEGATIPGPSIIQPSMVMANTTSLFSGAPIAAIVLVDGTTGVAVTQLTIDGSVAATFFQCSPGYVGIFYRAASGAIQDTHVTNIFHPGAPGCQTVLAIFVQSANGGPGLNSSVAITNNKVDVYGKNGITANEPGTFVTVTGNTVMGRGVTMQGDAAQNGVQIGFGARGLVSGNTISMHNYMPPDFVACGVLFFRGGGGVGRAKNNTFAANEQDICNAGGGPSPNAPPFEPAP